jgi:glycosyltransferase involved in cell wall biosynthesis
MKARILVIIPTFNRASFLMAAIRSVQDQTNSDWRLIVVDDNSTDDTAAMIETLSRTDHRISLVRSSGRQLGPGGARALGLTYRQNEDYVAFLDSDDTWMDYHIERLLGFLDGNKDVGGVFGDLRRCLADGSVLIESSITEEIGDLNNLPHQRRGDFAVLSGRNLLTAALRVRLCCTFQSAMFRSSVFDSVMIRPLSVGEDVLFTMEFISQGFVLAIDPLIHVKYIAHDSNISGANTAKEFGQVESVALSEETLWSNWIPAHVPLSRSSKKVIRQRLTEVRVWWLAYSCYQSRGEVLRARHWIIRAIKNDVFSPLAWRALAGLLLTRIPLPARKAAPSND